jgi:hypothetical protein
VLTRNDSLSQRMLSTACSLPARSGGTTPAEPTLAAEPAAPSRSPKVLPQGENLLFAPPKNFKIGHHDERIGSLTEFVPDGQTVEDWTEMVTVQIFHDLKVDPAPFLQTIGKGFAKGCPGFNSPKGIVTGQENGYVVSMLVVRCPNNPSTGKPETTLFRVIRGKDALYSVQHAWRSVASDRDLGDAVLALRKVILCDTRDPSHPCPSFDSLSPTAPPKPKS